MSRTARIRTEAVAGGRTFLRRRTALMFTFVFPLVLVLIFGVLIRTDPGAGGIFAEDPSYYLAGYLAIVVMFTPLSRLAAEVLRHKTDRRFEKLATTPISRAEWLLAHTAITCVIVLLACGIIVAVLGLLTDVSVPTSPVVIVFVILGVVLFSGMGAMIGRLAQTQDGAIAASNTIALPMLFLAETFVPPALLPEWFQPVIGVLPLTPFTRGVRAVVMTGDPYIGELVVLAGLAGLFLLGGAALLPWTE